MGGRQQLWCTADLQLWHCSPADIIRRELAGWDDLWDYEPVADPILAAMTRLADPERYDIDGVRNHPERDEAARNELHRLHLRHFAIQRHTPSEVFKAIRSGIYSNLGMHDGIAHYYVILQEPWVSSMLNAGWSTQRIAQTVGRPHRLIAAIATEFGREDRRIRAHARAARLRRIARLKQVQERDGRWTEEHYHAKLTRVLRRAGLSHSDLPDDVAYLN